jgi:cytidine deaminase
MEGSELASVIEFQRTVHAEMAAILNAQRHNSSVQGATLYTTSFPCHICAKHILGTGIARVVYIEPYPKSRAFDLYPEEITLEGDGSKGTIPFRSFTGIAPRLYPRVFTARGDSRMTPEGRIRSWQKDLPMPKLGQTDESFTGPAEDRAIRAAELSMIANMRLRGGPRG